VIERGEVVVSGAPALKPSRLVAPSEPIVVAGPPARFVGRGGEKLDAALERFGIDLTDSTVLDAGSSTGGFTDCALQRGARRVVAVDVGRGQLHHRLRTDARVDVRERTNVRHLAPGDLGPPADVVVADLSFISLRTVAPALIALARPGADLVWLIKPQFEAGRREASRHHGVIRDPAIWRRVLEEITAALEGLRAAIMDLMTSPITGADGNVEFLVHARVAGCSDGDVATMIETALDEAARR
jgi:23S rRNA (cytidine1920-2'-O)/16S rRNA (cytidine1409-2'-O)-methyltransferase